MRTICRSSLFLCTVTPLGLRLRLRFRVKIRTRIRFKIGLGNGVKRGPHKYRNTNACVGLFPGYFISIIGKVSTVHAQCCVVVVVVIVVLIDITIDVYNYRPLKRVFEKQTNKKHI